MYKTIFALYKKEILDILRDKKTILVMVLIPILLYPLLFLGAIYAGSAIASNQQETTYRIAFEDVAEEKAITDVMMNEEDDLDYLFKVVEAKNWKKALKEKEIDACITVKQKGKQTVYRIQYISSINTSSTAADRMLDVLEEYREQLRIQAIEENGLDTTQTLYPILGKQVDHASTEENFGSMLGTLVPFLMIVSMLMGAIYPAIDATAGEKERGTLETLLTLPVSNFELIMSKFFAVSTIAAVSALLNFASMGIIGSYVYSSFKIAGAGNTQIQLGSFLPAVVLILLCVLVFAMFLSALCLCICIFAKSFKEAQNYSTPLLLVVMMIGYVGFIPDIELNSTYAVIPIVNVVLLVKDIFVFKYSFGNLLFVLVTNLVYSFLAVLLMSKMYNSESLLFGEGGSVKLFERRANMKKGQMPGMGDAFLLLAVCLLGMFYLGSVASAKYGFWGVPIQQLILLVFTLGFAWYMKVDGKKLFSLKVPKAKAVIGSLFLWAGSYLVMLVLTIPLSKWFPTSLEQLELQNKMFAEQPVWAVFFVVAICPAICEELLFRGFLFGTMKEKWKPAVAMVVSGVIFAAYHMSVIKLVTISVLGIALAYSVYCSKSLITSMLMHFCNNAIAVIGFKYPEAIGKVAPFLMEENPGLETCIGMTIAGVVFVVLGIFLLKKKRIKSRNK